MESRSHDRVRYILMNIAGCLYHDRYLIESRSISLSEMNLMKKEFPCMYYVCDTPLDSSLIRDQTSAHVIVSIRIQYGKPVRLVVL